MGNSLGGCCCCCPDEVVAPTPQRRAREDHRARPYQAAAAHSPLQTGPRSCPTCGRVLDASMYDGHRETCRVQHRQTLRDNAAAEKARAASAPPPPRPAPGTAHDAAECVVCLDQPRQFAIVPCGHVSLCRTCVARVDSCPLCRGPCEGRLDVGRSVDLCRCRVCKQTIAPTFFDAHQEVCRMQLRQLRGALGAEAAAAAGSEENQAALCVECKAAPRDCALLPCGHIILCNKCAEVKQACPYCASAVARRLSMFDV